MQTQTGQLTRRKFLATTSRALALSTLALVIGGNYGIRAQMGTATARKIVPHNAGPPVRANHSLIYDAKQDRLIVFGGSGNGGVLNDVWAFSLTDHTWAELTPREGSAPAPRLTPTAVYDAKKHRMIIYSGQGAGFFNDTWALDLAVNQWAELKGAEKRPAPRYGTILAYDAKRHAAVTFAGFTSEGGRFDDTWSFSLDSAGSSPVRFDGL